MRRIRIATVEFTGALFGLLPISEPTQRVDRDDFALLGERTVWKAALVLVRQCERALRVLRQGTLRLPQELDLARTSGRDRLGLVSSISP